MTDERLISRRVFLARAGTLTLTLGAARLCRAAPPHGPYQRGTWLAGDHHIHTRYSPDGQYEIGRQVAAAAQHGLSWCVITDHGGPMHDKVLLRRAYPELVVARKEHPGMTVFQGLEWNVPAAEHASVILPPTPDEASLIAEFEARYDQLNISRRGTPANTEAHAIAAIRHLQSLVPRPVFIANHPARRGRNSPAELRNWAEAGPDVARGFEAAAGHQAATLAGLVRGHYEKKPTRDSWPGYPPESYRTHGGYDWYVTRVGGLWDSLLGEGRPWFITANSDSHRHYTDHSVPNQATYLVRGYVTPTTQQAEKTGNMDFWPGEYTKTWVFAASSGPLDILDAIRAGNMFPVHGDLVDRLELTATTAEAAAPMGGSLLLNRPGQEVSLSIRLRVPDGPNHAGRRPVLHHVDLISGEVSGPAADRQSMTNPTTRVVARFEASGFRREGPYLVRSHRFTNVRRSFYVRLRGTNRDLLEPELDPLTINPWDDLWFYSNPVMIRLQD
jgi:predicted metal-dependent phosphoesterase TrpH